VRERVRFICLAFLLVSLVMLAVSFATAEEGRTFFGPPLGADFAGFYTAGTILNQPRSEDRSRLYDFAYFDEVYHQQLPRMPQESKLPFLHPPFVAWAFRPLARLAYPWAFAIWFVLTAGFYVAGLAMTWTRRPAGDWLTALLLALSFEPFVMEAWLGGQLSAVGFLCVAAALAFERRNRPFAAGMAWGICLYKPTLLVLVLPLVIIAPVFRRLAGFCLAGLGLAALSWAGAGSDNFVRYGRVLVGFAQSTAGASGATSSLELRLWKYVDINSFLRLILGGPSAINIVVLLLTGALVMGLLVPAWRRLGREGCCHRDLVLAATLTWTLVLNLYVGVYDTILVVHSLLLTAAWLCRSDGSLPHGFRTLMIVMYLVPWVTQPIARATSCQVYCIVLAVVAGYQLWLVWKRVLPPIPSEDVLEQPMLPNGDQSADSASVKPLQVA
jgi:hypothetical protein